jgi:hypothetical protein
MIDDEYEDLMRTSVDPLYMVNKMKEYEELLERAHYLLCDIANDGVDVNGNKLMYSCTLGDEEWMEAVNTWCSDKSKVG